MECSVTFEIDDRNGRMLCVLSGEMEFEVVPVAGDELSFLFPGTGNAMPNVGFSGLLRVKSRVLDVARKRPPQLMLSDVGVESAAAAKELADYFEANFSLIADYC